MEVTTTVEGTRATMVVSGRLTVTTAPELEAEVDAIPAIVTDVVMDISALDFISSAGLRLLVCLQKLMRRRGGALTLAHPVDEVYDVFETTGLDEVLSIER